MDTENSVEPAWIFSLYQDTEERREEVSLLLLQLWQILSGVPLLGKEGSDP